MLIRRATLKDFRKLYALGKKTPELQVSATEVFMDEAEFKWCLKNRHGVFLLAEEKKELQGFIYANTHDMELAAHSHNWACLVYLVVAKKFRRHSVGSQLYRECMARLKARGVSHVYAWARAGKNNSIMKFLRQEGFKPGQSYVWMDKKIG